MKNNKTRFILACLFVCAAAGPALAQVNAGEEAKLEACAAELNKDHSEGKQRVADKIKTQFGVDDARLMGLHFRRMNNGDIAIALGLAQGMRRVITDKNLQRIVALREGPPEAGWGKVAKELGVKLGPVISKLRKVSAEVRKQEKADTAEKEIKSRAEEIARKDGGGQPGKTEKAGMKSLSRQ
jgi:hypothetical protein